MTLKSLGGLLLSCIAGVSLAADRLEMPSASLYDDVARAQSKASQSINASENSRALYGIDRWQTVSTLSEGSHRYFVEAFPRDGKREPTSVTVEIQAKDGITVAVQLGGRLRSITHTMNEKGESATFLTPPNEQRIELQRATNRNSVSWKKDVGAMRAILEVMANSRELRGMVADVALDMPMTLMNTLDSGLASASAGLPNQKLNNYCYVPIATIGSVAAAINYHLGPGGSVTCAASCAGTAACMFFGAFAANPGCFVYGTACAGCGAVGLSDVVDTCIADIYFEMK